MTELRRDVILERRCVAGSGLVAGTNVGGSSEAAACDTCAAAISSHSNVVRKSVAYPRLRWSSTLHFSPAALRQWGYWRWLGRDVATGDVNTDTHDTRTKTGDDGQG